jgi:hypothetical protein
LERKLQGVKYLGVALGSDMVHMGAVDAVPWVLADVDGFDARAIERLFPIRCRHEKTESVHIVIMWAREWVEVVASPLEPASAFHGVLTIGPCHRFEVRGVEAMID